MAGLNFLAIALDPGTVHHGPAPRVLDWIDRMEGMIARLALDGLMDEDRARFDRYWRAKDR